MWCYKDKVFCPFWEECEIGDECDRALTEEVRQGALSISVPISRYKDHPDCFRDKEEETDEKQPMS